MSLHVEDVMQGMALLQGALIVASASVNQQQVHVSAMFMGQLSRGDPV